jgi:autoinducer 2-degrading protein
MWVVIAEFITTPEARDTFLAALVADGRESRAHEPGNVRFDVMIDPANPNRILVYEASKDLAAFEAHLRQPWFARYNETVQGLGAAVTRTIHFRGPTTFP